MNAIRNVFTAFANLAASINGLAAVVDSVSAKVRQAAALEDATAAAVPALPGEVIDNDTADTSSHGSNGHGKPRGKGKAASATV